MYYSLHCVGYLDRSTGPPGDAFGVTTLPVDKAIIYMHYYSHKLVRFTKQHKRDHIDKHTHM